MFIVYFFLWTCMLYWIHRIGHKIPFVMHYHLVHHSFINKNLKSGELNGWHWNNLFLFNDNIESTIDLWITEVTPTIVFALVTNQWWILVFYYIWAAFIQEPIEHNPNINLPFILSGKRHLIHHKHSNKNYGLFFPIWDIVFRTYKN